MPFLDAMQNAWNNFTTNWAAMRRVFENPAYDYVQDNIYQRELEYMLLWAYYNGSLFDDTVRLLNMWAVTGLSTRTWSTYKANYRLPRTIRGIYNPTRKLVDFYVSNVYPGVLSEDGEDLPDGVASAIPFS